VWVDILSGAGHQAGPRCSQSENVELALDRENELISMWSQQSSNTYFLKLIVIILYTLIYKLINLL